MNNAKRLEWSVNHPISIASIDMIAFRLNRIGKLSILEQVLQYQEDHSVPVCALCLFIDNFEEVRPDDTKTVHWPDEDLHGLAHDKPTPDDFTKLLTR